MGGMRVRRDVKTRTMDAVSDDNPLPVALIEDPVGLSMEEMMSSLLTQQKLTNAYLSIVTGCVLDTDAIPDEVQ